MSKLLNMSWRFDENFDASGKAYGKVTYTYGDSLETNYRMQVAMPNYYLATELYNFILHISTFQWKRGYNAAIAEIEYAINGMKEE